MKRGLALLAIRDIQIKTLASEWLKLKRLEWPNLGKDMDQLILSNTAVGSIKWYNQFENC